MPSTKSRSQSGSEDLPQPLPPPLAPLLQLPHLAPLLQLPELQRDGAENPLLIAAGQLPAVNARWMTRTHFVSPDVGVHRPSESPEGRLTCRLHGIGGLGPSNKKSGGSGGE